MKPVLLALTCAVSLALAGGAHAEKWTYFPVPGGALAYETDGLKVDATQGQTEGDALTYYFVPQALAQVSYSILIQRLDFKCRENQYRIMGLTYFDLSGNVVASGESSSWMPTPPMGSPIATFGHVFCTKDRSPLAKDSGDLDTLVPVLKALPPTTQRGVVAPPASITLPAAKP